MKRSTRFYRRNESKVMLDLGFVPTKNSGAGWVQKEDGENEVALCQLKSTDGQSITVRQVDLRLLEQNAAIAHKRPVFAVQFLNTGEIWLMVKPSDLMLTEKRKTDIFAEVSEKGVDNTEETCYTVGEETRREKQRKQIRERYHTQRKEEETKRQREYRNGRKRRWSRS